MYGAGTNDPNDPLGIYAYLDNLKKPQQSAAPAQQNPLMALLQHLFSGSPIASLFSGLGGQGGSSPSPAPVASTPLPTPAGGGVTLPVMAPPMPTPAPTTPAMTNPLVSSLFGRKPAGPGGFNAPTGNGIL